MSRRDLFATGSSEDEERGDAKLKKPLSVIREKQRTHRETRLKKVADIGGTYSLLTVFVFHISRVDDEKAVEKKQKVTVEAK